jgi:Domain of unknown function (DU1801)
MAAQSNKTRATTASVQAFLDNLTDKQQQDSQKLIKIMSNISGQSPVMWGSSIIGFGQYHYVYESGRQGDGPAISFSPRKSSLVVYFAEGLSHHQDLLGTLGPHTTGKGCLYIKRLSGVDTSVLEQMLEASYQHVTAHDPMMHRAE